MTDKDRILDKIKRCMALSESPNPHEAASALRQAQKLMELYDLSQVDLVRSSVGHVYVKSKASVSVMKDWEIDLIEMVARSFGCCVLWNKSKSSRDEVYGRFKLIGLKDQLQMASYTCEVLQRKLMKGRQEFVANLHPWLTRSEKIAEGNGYCHGWVKAIENTVHEFAMPTDLKDLIQTVTDEMCTGIADVKHVQVGDYGFAIGELEGADESIQRPVEEKDRSIRVTHENGCLQSEAEVIH